MKRLMAAALPAVALMCVAAPAQAATDLGTVVLTDQDPGTDFFSFFQYSNFATTAGDYLINFAFDFANTGNGAGDISASLVRVDNTVFNSVTLNGTPFTLSDGNTLGAVNGAPIYGTPLSNVLAVNFKVLRDGTAAFNGSVSAAAVPEPSTWAMLLLGFGLVGFGLRRRQAATPRVKFHMA